MKKWSSHQVVEPEHIYHRISFPMDHDREFFQRFPIILQSILFQYWDPKANNVSLNTKIAAAPRADTRTRAIFVLAAKKPPYCVYTNPFYEHATYGSVYSVDSTGTLQKNIQNYFYSDKSAIHGMVFDSSETYLYSADMWANKVWTHKKNADGTLELVGSVDAPDTQDHPRWVAIHPNDKYLYALMEQGNNIAVYKIDEETHMPVYTGKSYPLLDENALEPIHENFRSDVVAVSHSGKYLFASARGDWEDPRLKGYVTVFKLAEDGTIAKQLYQKPTSTSGGHSNAVAPSDWSDEWLALTDDEKGFVEVYRWKDEDLTMVAHLDLDNKFAPGFAMNAIWYD